MSVATSAKEKAQQMLEDFISNEMPASVRTQSRAGTPQSVVLGASVAHTQSAASYVSAKTPQQLLQATGFAQIPQTPQTQSTHISHTLMPQATQATLASRSATSFSHNSSIVPTPKQVLQPTPNTPFLTESGAEPETPEEPSKKPGVKKAKRRKLVTKKVRRDDIDVASCTESKVSGAVSGQWAEEHHNNTRDASLSYEVSGGTFHDPVESQRILSLSPLLQDAAQLENHISGYEQQQQQQQQQQQMPPSAHHSHHQTSHNSVVEHPSQQVMQKVSEAQMRSVAANDEDVLKELATARQAAEHLKIRVHEQQYEIRTLRDQLRLFGEATERDGQDALVIVLQQLADSEKTVAELRAKVDGRERVIDGLRQSMHGNAQNDCIFDLERQIEALQHRNAVLEAENRQIHDSQHRGATGPLAQERLKELQHVNRILKTKAENKAQAMQVCIENNSTLFCSRDRCCTKAILIPNKENESGDCTTIATQLRQLHYNKFIRK